jgi:hypothetical protein
MKPVVYAAERLRAAFEAAKVMTMDVILEVLGKPTRMTAFRKLAALGYRASYSHGGRYYTLDEIANFDAHGLWRFDDARFSMHGCLLDTVEHLVNTSSEGCYARELHALVEVGVHNALAKLYQGGRLNREQLGGEFLYISAVIGQGQLRRREQRLIQAAAPSPQPDPAFGQVTAEQFHTLLKALNEKQRRLYLGFESLKLGHGGDVRIARISGVNVKTIARGRSELESGHLTMDRIRAAGAGRPSVKKNRSDQFAE